MYSITREPFGFRLVFTESFDIEQATNWISESERELANQPGGFGVFVDMRGLKPLLKEAQAKMEEGQKLYKSRGMVRSIVILDSKVMTLQFRRIAKQTGIAEWERYIDSTSEPRWEAKGEAWITRGEDPDPD